MIANNTLKNLSFTKTVVVLSTFFTLVACGGNGSGGPALPDDPATEKSDSSSSTQPSGPQLTDPVPTTPVSEREQILQNYQHLDPKNIVPTAPLENALIYFHKNKSALKNQKVLTLLDFSKSSKQKRLFIINMTTGSVWALHVSHGKGSDSDHDGFAEKFSNVSGSNASSLGYYITDNTYYGGNGYSLKMDGKSSTNSRARSRAIVVHGANYVQDTSVIQGRSWGCPAVSMENHKKVIDTIKNGSLLYAFK